MMTLGAFVTLILTAALASLGIVMPVPLAFVAMFPAMVITAFLAIGLDRTFYKPLRQAGARPVVLVMASVGVTLMLQGVIRLFAGVRGAGHVRRSTKGNLPDTLSRRLAGP